MIYCQKVATFAFETKWDIMSNNTPNLESLNFNDVVGPGSEWTVLFNDCGIALSDTLPQFFLRDSLWETRMFVFIACLKGQLRLNDQEKVISQTAGDVLVQMPGAIISKCSVTPDFRCKVLCLAPEVFANSITESKFFDWALMVSENPIIHIGYDEKALKLIDAYETILKIKASGNRYNRTVIINFTACLLYEITHRQAIDESALPELRKASNYSVFKKFIELAAHDKGTSRSVKVYAAMLHVSPKYLSAICRKYSGRTAYEWINFFLKKELERLLRYTDLSIKEIAGQLSFPDCSFFSKYVRRHYDMTALEYRARLRSQK